MQFFSGKNVLVTGATGMIGSHLTERLVKLGAHVRVPIHSRGLENLSGISSQIDAIKADLTRESDCKDIVKGIDFVFHLAAVVGGVAYNTANPGSLFAANVLMQTNLLEASRQANVQRFLYTSSACVYPAICKIPIQEEECVVGEFDRPPEPTNAAYGWAKRIGELQASYYRQQYGMKIAIVRPFNAYGPRDNFDLQSSHVIPALIRKALERQHPFAVWGNGEPSRDFVYAADIAEGMMLAIEKSTDAQPINLASGMDIQIKELVKLVLEATNYSDAEIVYEKSKPLGQMKRLGSIEKAKKLLGWEAKVPLKEGIKRTVSWYLSINQNLTG